MKKLANRHLFSIFMLAIVTVFYLFFAFYDGAVICVDSPSYIGMSISREPLYPIILAFFRSLFSNFSSDFYLTATAFFQSILAALTTWAFAVYALKEFKLTKLFSLIILITPPVVSLLCRFAAKRGSMYSNSILTEGIAIPCYFLFFRCLMEFLLHQRKKALIFCCLLAFLLISTRKQMAIALIMLVIGILYHFIKERRYLKGIIISFLCMAGILLSTVLLDLGYNYVLCGELTKHSGDTRFITTMALYTADRNDAQFINDKEIQNLFLQIYDICDENGYLKNSAGQGWLNRVSHFGDYYDCIQIDTLRPMVSQFASERRDNLVDASEYGDQIMDTINHSIIPHHIPEILGTFADNFLSGLVTTVAKRNSILIWYSLFIYLFYFTLLAWHIGVGKNQKTILFATFTLISIFVNVSLVSLVIFCQTRYTIYNMALFLLR